MDMQNQKCVMVMDEDLPLGVIANTAGIMGITLGKHMPETVGPDVRDKSGREHLGIIEFPVPILKADKEKIRSIREQLYQPCYSDLMVVDFSDVAQGCRTYDEFIDKCPGRGKGIPVSWHRNLRFQKTGQQTDRKPSPAEISNTFILIIRNLLLPQ